jgi:uncharacterized membrane protein YdbT with pleckstrin-like domain
MITVNTINKYSNKVYLRYITPCFIVIFFISLITLATGKISDAVVAFFVLSLMIGVPYSLFFILRIKSYSFVVTENSITQNYGIITKKSETVNFDKIQNIKSSSSILNRLFGLTQLTIWTASPSQAVINNGTSQNEPNIILLLDSADANWLKNYLSSKNNPPTQTTSSPLVGINL